MDSDIESEETKDVNSEVVIVMQNKKWDAMTHSTCCLTVEQVGLMEHTQLQNEQVCTFIPAKGQSHTM